MAAIFSAPVQTGPGAHPASCTMGTGSFPGVKSGRGVTVSPHPPSSAVVKKEQSYTSTPPTGRRACTEPQCLYKGAVYLFFSNPYQKGGNTCTKTWCHLDRTFHGTRAYTHFMAVDTNVTTVYRTELPPAFPPVSTC